MVKLLEQEGLYNAGKRLRPEVQVVHLGDLINGVVNSRDEDLKCLKLVGPVIDLYIPGNHETPYFGFDTFHGFFLFPEIKDELRQLDADGLIHPAIAVGDVLLSHAGLASKYQDGLQSPEEAVQRVTEAFLRSPFDPIVGAIGYARGGRQSQGGIFWSDWSESKCTKFAQIVGHTAGNAIRMYTNDFTGEERHSLPSSMHDTNIPLRKSNEMINKTYCIDLGCNSTGWNPSNTLAGVWLTENNMRFVTYTDK